MSRPRVPPALRRTLAPAALLLAPALALTGCDSERGGQLPLDPATAEQRAAENEAYTAEQDRLAREGYPEDDD